MTDGAEDAGNECGDEDGLCLEQSASPCEDADERVEEYSECEKYEDGGEWVFVEFAQMAQINTDACDKNGREKCDAKAEVIIGVE